MDVGLSVRVLDRKAVLVLTSSKSESTAAILVSGHLVFPGDSYFTKHLIPSLPLETTG